MFDAQKKYDVIDLIITTLQDHEKKLDDLTTRLDRIVNRLEWLYEHR